MSYISNQYSTIKTIFILFFSILVGTSYVLALRYSRGILNETYNPQNLVFISECCKFIVCIMIISSGVGGSSLSETNHSQIGKIMQLIRVSGYAYVPAICYFIQNILDYKACEYLPACVYSSLLQLKILSKALLSIWILNKSLTFKHWRALFVLLIGSFLMEFHLMEYHNNTSDSNDPIKGTLFVGIIIILSGFAGCMTELLLKNQQLTTQNSADVPTELTLWDRNVQISFWSVLCGFVNVQVSWMTGLGGDNRFFDGFSYVSVILIILLSCIGLSVSVITKYTDVIINSFVSVMSMVFICLASQFLFHDDLDFIFVIGVILTMVAAFEYNNAGKDNIIENADKEEALLQIENDGLERAI